MQTKDTEDRTQIDKVAMKWMHNIEALIKLRQSGTTKVSKLPTGVLRYVLDYQYPNELCVRYSDTYWPIKVEEHTHFPATHKLDYNNYLVTVN